MIFNINFLTAQVGNNQIYIKNILGSTVKAYLLTATRPYYNIDATTNDKGEFGLELSANFSGSIFDLPAYITYGITNNLEVWANIPVYSQAYNFGGNKIQGFGDITSGLRFKFQESKYFSHTLQAGLKIPTASFEKQMGTGKVDFHIATAQELSINRFVNLFYLELNFLRKRPLPLLSYSLPAKLKDEIVDSYNNVYNYKYEPEFTISVNPGFYIVKDVLQLYTGIYFTRNYKLDFNISSSFFGIGWLISKNFAVDIGGNYGIINSGNFSFSGSFLYSL